MLAKKPKLEETQLSLEAQLQVKGAEDDRPEDPYIERFHGEEGAREARDKMRTRSAPASLKVSSTEALAWESRELGDTFLRARLLAHWRRVRAEEGKGEELDEEERVLWEALYGYSDVMDCSAASTRRELYTAHVVNHVLKFRDRSIKGTLRLKRGAEEVRDRGFCRPTVLVVLPMRNQALLFVQELLRLVPALERVDGRQQFVEQFSTEGEETPDYSSKSEHFRRVFSGNVDDSFRIGIKLSRKRVKLFADFYRCDVIVASPLGLRTIVDAEGSKAAGMYDFLSTIQVVVVDDADTLMMQNWAHLESIFEQLNQIPELPRDTDFSRLQAAYAEGKGAPLRQTCVFSTVETPELRALFSQHCSNAARTVIRRPLEPCTRLISPHIKQMFNRFASDSVVDDADARFAFFTQQMLPELVQSGRRGVLIYIPSYFDFVRLRNYATKEFLSAQAVSEYCTQGEQTRARARFADAERDVSFLLYTERFHFYRRYALKGVQSVVFYQAPTLPQFYTEVLASIPTSTTSALSITLYSSFDKLRLQRVVGTSLGAKMVRGEQITHVI